MASVFDPDELHDIAKQGIAQGGDGNKDAIFSSIEETLQARYPKHIERDNPWIFNNAGGAMGAMKLLHCSLSEYVILFGSAIGTEGHSGRYSTEVWDFMLDGEMWTYFAGDFEKTVYVPGDKAYLGADRAKGYCLPERGWMLEYSRGSIPSMLPFGLANTMFSTLDTSCTKTTLKQYGGMVVKELLQGKF
jgi:hypothetical protein